MLSGVTDSAKVPAYPTSAPKKHDWDKLEAMVKMEEEAEKLEGDAALNQLFQKIYGQGSEETRRAMNKSFVSILTYFLLYPFVFHPVHDPNFTHTVKIFFSLRGTSKSDITCKAFFSKCSCRNDVIGRGCNIIEGWMN